MVARAAQIACFLSLGAMAAACGQPFQVGTGTAGGGGASSSWSATVSASSTTSASTTQSPCVGQTGCVEEFVGAYQVTGTADLTGTAARFSHITGITGNGVDTLWVADGSAVRSIDIATGVVNTLQGLPPMGPLGGIVYVGNAPPMLLVSDTTHNVIRRIDPANPKSSTVFSGAVDTPGSTDGATPTYTSPGALAWVAGSGRYFVIDGDAVRFFFNGGGAGTVGPTGAASTLVAPAGLLAEVTPGSAAATYTLIISQGNDLLSLTAPSTAVTPWTSGVGCGSAGYQDGVCSSAQFKGPHGLAWRDANTIFVADTLNNRVRQVAWPTGVDTLVGDGVAGHKVGLLKLARIDGPTAVFFSGNELFIVDAAGTEIRKVKLL